MVFGTSKVFNVGCNPGIEEPSAVPAGGLLQHSVGSQSRHLQASRDATPCAEEESPGGLNVVRAGVSESLPLMGPNFSLLLGGCNVLFTEDLEV